MAEEIYWNETTSVSEGVYETPKISRISCELSQNAIKRLLVSVGILCLISSLFTIVSLAMINELKQETFLNTLEMRQLADLQTNISKAFSKMFPQSCNDVNLDFVNISGTGHAVRIFPSNSGEVQAYCRKIGDQIWTVFQRRKDGRVDFFRDWNDYVRGFGNPNGEFWLGLEAIHQLTKTGKHELSIDMEDMNGKHFYAAYSSFSVGSGFEHYPLRVDGYSGNASDSLRVHNNDKFSTKDKDNDANSSKHCAQLHNGAWWYSSCFHSNLNGLYGARNESGVVWGKINEKRTEGYEMYMRFTEMKFRKTQ